jgi:hypothetical protein
MIRVNRGREVRPGIFAYCVVEPADHAGISWQSRQPLLDACRQIKRMGGDPSARCSIFREGRTEADLTCTVGVGAGLTVEETQLRGPYFAKWKPYNVG